MTDCTHVYNSHMIHLHKQLTEDEVKKLTHIYDYHLIAQVPLSDNDREFLIHFFEEFRTPNA